MPSLQVVFDSDYTLMMLARISHLTSLRVEYRTWPLSLAQDDLSLLAPLTALHTLHLACCDGEGEGDPGLLALTSRSLAELCQCCKEMRSFHYSGIRVICVGSICSSVHVQDLYHHNMHACLSMQYRVGPIVLSDSKCPELSLWSNLTELDLCHVPDEAAPFLLELELPTCLPTSLRSLSLC